MPRMVLVGLADENVDVLTRIPGLDPRPDVLVFHPDPDALILRLATLADLATVTEPPVPQSDDLVIARESEKSSLLEPWRRVGASIQSPESVGAMSKEKSEEVSLRGDETKPRAKRAPSSESRELPEQNGGKTTPTDASSKPSSRSGSGPAVEVWENPEATFRYVVEQTAGDKGSVTLWWDGNEGEWVPWIWTGKHPIGEPPFDGEGTPLKSEFGTFYLTGSGRWTRTLNRAAITRVAEDLALRDLAEWRRTESLLREQDPLDPSAERTTLAAWFEPVLPVLGAEVILIWRESHGGWRLVHTRGEGVSLTGELLLPTPLLSATFETQGSPWREWDPAPGLRLLFTTPGEDRRWPIRIRRLERVLRSGDDA